MADEAKDKDMKAISLDEEIQRIRGAWRVQHPYPSREAQPAVESDGWVTEVFEDRVIVQMSDGLLSYPYTVDDDDEIEFGEPTEVEIDYKPARSLNPVMAVKSLSETDDAYIIGGYGMRWGSPTERDLSPWPNKDGSKGEFFTPDTKGMDDIPVKVLTFEHDMDKDDKGQPIKEILGHVILERDQSVGRWVEARIEKARQYAGRVIALVEQGVMSFSSETATHWREVADNGELKRWRTAGFTLTTGPAEPRQTDVSQLKAAFKSAAIDFPDDQPKGEEPDDGGAGTGVPGQDQLELQAAKASIEIMLTRIDIELEV